MEKRTTNAKKYWSTYVKKPAKSCQNIRDKLIPYINRLPGGTQNFYSEIMEEIMDKFGPDTFTNVPLNENYLLGYYNQYADFRKQKEDKKDEQADE